MFTMMSKFADWIVMYLPDFWRSGFDKLARERLGFSKGASSMGWFRSSN